MSGSAFDVTLVQESGYQFTIDFDQPGVARLTVDESAPIGNGAGPNPARLLAGAIGHCLSASLLFCLQKARVPVEGMTATVQGELARNEQGRLRISRLAVQLRAEVAVEDKERMARCIGLFEDFCIVTESVRDGIDVQVAVASVDASQIAAGS